MSGAFRCSRASAALAEPLAGTASTVRAFLLLEVRGPWGVDALRDCRLPAALAAELDRRCRASGVRPLLIRRHGRSRGDAIRCFGAYADPHRPWMEGATLARHEDVLDLDLNRLGAGRPIGLDTDPDPVFLVCTHGRHDACCAERGRPIAAAMTASHPAQTWECSHIGGDRFAGNLLVLPDGLYYGRADAQSGPAIAAAHLTGRLDLDHLRGRAGFGFATQAAEWHLRRHLDVTGTDRLRLELQGSADGVTHALFRVDESRRWRVRVRTDHGEPRQLTCQSAHGRRALRFALVGIDALDP
ncbi:MAG: sucrase ferredoxin [Actinomycetota bacterium]|nr:sucrase ferredoxin [Actinomycetota bacterium]